MKVTPTAIPDAMIIEPEVYGDERGFFFESFNQKKFEQAIGKKVDFVQDNHSKSVRGVLRGLHYQLPPHAQAKLVRVIQGMVYDVVVDLRTESETFGQWAGEVLSEENKKQLWIPEGFAHGFLTLTDTAELLYKTSDYYMPESERAIAWNDHSISIEWYGLEAEPVLSNKDKVATSFLELLSKSELF